MIEQKIISLKKQIFYRCTHTGTKESDLLFQKLIVKKIDNLKYEDLIQLSNLFTDLSDSEIFLILNNEIEPNEKYKDLFIKLMI